MSDARSPRGPYRGTARRQAEILRAAFEEFATAGYAAASLRTIAARVGISHAGLLHHFASKEELLVAVLAQHEEQERALLVPDAEPTTLDSLTETLLASVAYYQQAPAVARLWAGLTVTATDPSHPGRQFVARRYAAWSRELAERLEAIKAAGGLRDDVDTASAAHTTLAVLFGGQLHRLADPSLDVAAMLRGLLDGYRPR